MSNEKQPKPLNIMEYYDWVAAQKFQNPQEHHRYVSYQEQDFLQKVIYPMFYKKEKTSFRTSLPFPLVLKDHSTRKPIYVIENEFLTIVFFSYDNFDDEICWEVSVHVKDHEFCDKRLISFAQWFREHYVYDSILYHIEMDGMPKDFLYPKLNFFPELYQGKTVNDFCIEFWNSGRDFMLFKLFDLLRIF